DHGEIPAAAPLLVRFPPDAPLVFERPPVLLVQGGVFTGGDERAERRLPEVVHEGIVGADDAVSRTSHANRQVLLLDHAHFDRPRFCRGPGGSPRRGGRANRCGRGRRTTPPRRGARTPRRRSRRGLPDRASESRRPRPRACSVPAPPRPAPWPPRRRAASRTR